MDSSNMQGVEYADPKGKGVVMRSIGISLKVATWSKRLGVMILGLSFCSGLALAQGPDNNGKNRRSVTEDFLRLGVRPIAIGHHGVGPNAGENPALPIENTVESVRLAYSLGARVVEVD